MKRMIAAIRYQTTVKGRLIVFYVWMLSWLKRRGLVPIKSTQCQMRGSPE